MAPKNKNKRYLAFVYAENDDLHVAVIDPDAEKCVETITLKKKNISQQLIGQKFKAIFLVVSGFTPVGYSTNYEFCKELKTQLNAAKISSHFFTELQWHLSGLAISTGFIPKIDDFVIFITNFGEFNAYIYQFTKTGYISIGSANIDFSASSSVAQIQAEIFYFCFPAAIIVNIGTSFERRLRKIFDESKFLGCDKKIFHEPQYIIQHSKWLANKSNANFHVRPISSVKVSLIVNLGDSKHSYMTYKIGQVLPCFCTKTSQKIVEVCSVALKDKDDKILTTLKNWLPDQNGHRHEITLSIDDEGFVEYEIKPILWLNITYIPLMLNKELKQSGIPVITFAENLSFICVHKNGRYQYLRSWNGSLGKDLYISFDEEKPKYCEDALAVARTKPTFVVFDIFHIMSLSPDNIEQEIGYKFEITKDNNYPVLLEFDNFDGTRKLSTPAFLMALLLKQHLKVIKEEIGEKPKEIAFSNFVVLNAEENGRIQDQLKEACEMLKITCSFLDYTEMADKL